MKTIDATSLSTVTGGGKLPKTAIAGMPGWFEQVKSKGIDLLVRAIKPNGKKTKWRSAGLG